MSRDALPRIRRSPLYVEFTLAHLIERSGNRGSRPAHRLDAFERTLALLSRVWRIERPLSPVRELRMSDETREELLAWVEAEEVAEGDALCRLAVYASGAVTDDAVPEGWVRLRLRLGGFGLSLSP
ncbi:MAG: hypothetical protein ACHQRK_08795 [Gemmatimonadales bacterium]|jgi:hypothetical protein